MAQVFKDLYENIGEIERLRSPTTLGQVTRLKKKLARDYLQSEPSYTLHRNHRVRGSRYRKTKAFFIVAYITSRLLLLFRN